MRIQPDTLDIRPRILYQVAKAAWEGKLMDRREDICQMVHNEYHDKATRRYVANQIRLAMGLDPHDSDTVITANDEEALMGISSEPIIVANPDACRHCPEDNRPCEKTCPSGAISHDQIGQIHIDNKKCLGEGHCVGACAFGTLAEKSQFVPLIKLLRQQTSPVYASVAPAFAGQFGEGITPGQLRSALLKLGFSEMIETALYADLITMKEAFEFNDYVKTAADFMITSCCCPVWIKLIENKFPDLAKHISPSVSPMVASARVIKSLEPAAKVVFIGPCIAKKSEALLPDVKGAVDFVLTFPELAAIFKAVDITLSEQPDKENPQASSAGRIYAYTGGVSDSVNMTLDKLVPRRAQKFSPVKVDGIPDCQKLLEDINNGHLEANFIEGMACKGGCVGGPGRLIPPGEGKQRVTVYSQASFSQTPAENPEVYALLTQLGQTGDKTSLTGESPISILLARKLKIKQ